MSRRVGSWLLCAGFVAGVGSSARAADALPADPAVVSGELANGLRYQVRRHAHPPGRAAIWLHIASGSLNETDRQRGIAHYLEHMAFNGSTNFPAGSLIPYFQGLGMTFGRDQNAFTNFEQTTYQLALPDVKAETVGRGLTFFADVLHRLLLAPKEIEAERQIIQEERRRGLSGRQRIRDQLLARTTPGSRVAVRETIGTEASIDGLLEQDFKDYYGAWYAASNAVLLVVADEDPAVLVAAIKTAFDSAPKRAVPASLSPGVRGYETSFAVVATDSEVVAEDVRILRIEPVRPPTTDVARWRQDLVIGLGELALNRRLEDKVGRGGTAFLDARVQSGNDGRLMWSWEISGRASPGRWKDTVEGLAVELQRARRHGFTAREVEQAKKQRVSQAERAVEVEGTITAQALLQRMNGSVVSGDTPVAPADRLGLLGKLLPGISPEEVSKTFATTYDPTAVAVVLSMPAGAGAPTEATLLEVGKKALASEPEAEAEAARATTLLSQAPKAGTVTSSEEHAGTSVFTAALSNGTVLHHRYLDTRKNEVTVEISLAGGELLETEPTRGLTSAAQVAWRTPATRSLSSADVRGLLTGKKTTVGIAMGGGRRGRGGGIGGVGSGAIALTVAGSPSDLETGLQLAHLLLSQPKIETAAFGEFLASTRRMLAEAERNPMALGMRTASSAPYPESDPRLTPLTLTRIDKITLDAAQAWLDRLVKESPIEVSVVGDLPRERAVELVAKYVGSLPARAAPTADPYVSLRKVARPASPRRVDRTLESATAQAFVLSGFYGPDEKDRDEVRALQLAAQILSTRLMNEVREKQQLVYSIGASFRPGSTYPGFGVFGASAPTEPHKVDALVAALASVYGEFAASGPTEAEMTVARKQAAVTFEEQTKEPSYWVTRLSLLALRGLSLDDVAADPAAYQALTSKRVKEVFAKHYAKATSLVVTVAPKGAPASAAPAAPPTKEAPKSTGALPIEERFDGAAAPLPAGFQGATGRWATTAETGGTNVVLRQDQPTQPWAVLLVKREGGRYEDGTASVRFRPVSGEEDASGGIVFRAQDPDNYYVVRANALEGNLRLYVVKGGERSQLASAEVAPPAAGAWHTLDVAFAGPRFKATLDGKDVVEATDSTFTAGWCGLWTKADSVTWFDDWKTTPATSPAPSGGN